MKELGDMLPRFAANDVIHVGATQAVLNGKLLRSSAASERLANGANVIFGELCEAMGRSLGLATAPLRFLICNVVRVGAEEKVMRVATTAIVARVEHMEVVWNRAIGQFPSDTVSANVAPIQAPSTVSLLRTELPVPTGVRASRAINMIPQIGGDVAAGLNSTSDRTIFPNLRIGRDKGGAAYKTDVMVDGILGEHSDRLLDRLIGVPLPRMLQHRGVLASLKYTKNPYSGAEIGVSA